MRRLSTTGESRLYTPNVLLLVTVVGISYLGLGFVLPLRQLYGRQIGASSVEIGFMASAALLAGFLATPLVGWLSDRYGPGTVLWVGVLMHSLLVLAYIPVQNPILLIGLRALEGIAAVGVLPPARALMNTIAPARRQGEALGLLGAAQSVGLLLGPGIGTLVESAVGYTSAFLSAFGPLAVGAVLAWIFLRRRVSSEHTRGSITRREAMRGLFTRPLRLAYVLQMALSIPTGIGAAVWSIFMADRGASVPLIGLSYTTFALPILIFAPLGGRISDSYGRYWPAIGAFALYGLVFVAYGFPISPLAIILISLVEGVAAAVARSAADGLLADVTPPHLRGMVQANYSAANTAGAFLSASAAGFLYALRPGAPFFAIGAVYFAVLACLLLPGVSALFPKHAHVPIASLEESESSVAAAIEAK